MSETASRTWRYRLAAEFDHVDITADAAALVAESGVDEGLVTVQLVGSTGAITTIEYEEGVLRDLRRALDLLAPVEADYAHDARWGDGNGFSHVRSALLKTCLSIPILDGRMALGTWQQLVVLNLDNRPRERLVVGLVLGA